MYDKQYNRRIQAGNSMQKNITLYRWWIISIIVKGYVRNRLNEMINRIKLAGKSPIAVRITNP